MKGRGIAALIAGFGTGYLTGERLKEEQARQAKKDKADEEDRQLRNADIKMRQDEAAAQKSREADALSGFESASKMKVGELRNEQGAIDNSEAAWQERIANTPDNEGNLPTAEVAAATAPIYAQEAAKKGSEKWLSSSAADAILGEVKPTSRGDIKRTEAAAMAKLGINGLPQSMALKEKADELDIKDLQTKILSATSVEELNDNYKIFPDGYDLKSEADPETGRLKYWYESDSGKKHFPDKAMPQDFADFEEMKKFASAFVSGNPEYIMQQYENSRKTKREDKKDAREEKVSNAQLEKYQQEIDKGAIELKSLPESIQLELKSKKANIAQSYAAAENSRASASKTKAESKSGATNDKLPNSVREALWYQEATPEQQKAFDSMNDKSPKVTSDGMGGFIINNKEGMYRMDGGGALSKLKLPDGTAPEIPKNRPPLSSFNK